MAEYKRLPDDDMFDAMEQTHVDVPQNRNIWPEGCIKNHSSDDDEFGGKEDDMPDMDLDSDEEDDPWYDDNSEEEENDI